MPAFRRGVSCSYAMKFMAGLRTISVINIGITAYIGPGGWGSISSRGIGVYPNVMSISDLAAHVNKNPDAFIFGVNAEFWERPDGFKRMMKVYTFRVPAKQVKKMSVGLTYKALQEGLVNSAMGFATDGRIAAFGFVNLEDDKFFFPVYNPVPVVRKEVLDRYPEIRTILKPIADNLTTQEMQRLNKAVDVDHKQVRDVAMEWLKDKNLIK